MNKLKCNEIKLQTIGLSTLYLNGASHDGHAWGGSTKYFELDVDKMDNVDIIK